MDLNPEMLTALAELPSLPRTPLTLNPCPDGYSIQLVEGGYLCVPDEEAEGDHMTDRLERPEAQALEGAGGLVPASPPGGGAGRGWSSILIPGGEQPYLHGVVSDKQAQVQKRLRRGRRDSRNRPGR